MVREASSQARDPRTGEGWMLHVEAEVGNAKANNTDKGTKADFSIKEKIT